MLHRNVRSPNLPLERRRRGDPAESGGNGGRREEGEEPARGAQGAGDGDSSGDQGGVPVHGEAVPPGRGGGTGSRRLHRDPAGVRGAVGPGGGSAVGRLDAVAAEGGGRSWCRAAPLEEVGDGPVLVVVEGAFHLPLDFLSSSRRWRALRSDHSFLS